MKIHVCLYLNCQEVININDVIKIDFFDGCILVTSSFGSTLFYNFEFDKIEVDYYD